MWLGDPLPFANEQLESLPNTDDYNKPKKRYLSNVFQYVRDRRQNSSNLQYQVGANVKRQIAHSR